MRNCSLWEQCCIYVSPARYLISILHELCGWAKQVTRDGVLSFRLMGRNLRKTRDGFRKWTAIYLLASPLYFPVVISFFFFHSLFILHFPTANFACRSGFGGDPCLRCRCARDLLCVVATATSLSNLLNKKKRRNREKSHPPPSAPSYEPKRRMWFSGIPYNPQPSPRQQPHGSGVHWLCGERTRCLNLVA